RGAAHIAIPASIVSRRLIAVSSRGCRAARTVPAENVATTGADAARAWHHPGPAANSGNARAAVIGRPHRSLWPHEGARPRGRRRRPVGLRPRHSQSIPLVVEPPDDSSGLLEWVTARQASLPAAPRSGSMA